MPPRLPRLPALAHLPALPHLPALAALPGFSPQHRPETENAKKNVQIVERATSNHSLHRHCDDSKSAQFLNPVIRSCSNPIRTRHAR